MALGRTAFRLNIWHSNGIIALFQQQKGSMATKNAKKRLEFMPFTIYIKPEDHKWFQEHAKRVSIDKGQPISVAYVIREALTEYKDKTER
jgi:hypothetical protein